MRENIKKILYIIGFAAVVILLGWALYYVFFKPAEQAKKSQQEGLQEQASLPETSSERAPGQGIISEGTGILPFQPEILLPSKVANGGPTSVNAVATENVFQPTLTSNGLYYYNSAEGRFYKALADGSITALSDKRFHNVSSINWSKDGSKAVLEYPDGSNIVYDFSKQKQYTLPKELQDFNFYKDGSKLSAEAIGPKEENNWLITINSDGSGVRFIEQLGAQADNVQTNWSPDGQIVALFRKNSGADSQDIILIGQNDENFQSIPVYGRGFEGYWDSSGQKLLYSVYSAENGFKPTLWITDARGSAAGFNNINLGVNTWANKCAFNNESDYAYCAVPRAMPAGAGVYPAMAEDAIDDFYKINLISGQRELIANPAGNQDGYNAKAVFLSNDGKALYFQDGISGSVFNINLP